VARSTGRLRAVVAGKTASIASGKPVRPSTQQIRVCRLRQGAGELRLAKVFEAIGRSSNEEEMTRDANITEAAEQSLREGGQEIAVEQNLRENHLVAASGWAVL